MRRSFALFAVVVSAGVVASACSSGSSPRETPSTGATTRAPAASTTTIAPTTTTNAPKPSADWPTYYEDAARSGSSTAGPKATPVQERWASSALDGEVYAQPLIVGDRVLIATENNTVYSLDSATGHIVWSRHLGTPVPGSDLPCGDVDPVGITGTPVVDTATSRLYVVGLIRSSGDVLFALDLRDGHVVASTGADAPGADPRVHNQRAALTLANGGVYVPYGGRFGDCGDYKGRIVAVAVTATGLGAATSYTLPTARAGGFWTPPGAALRSDGTFVITTGNTFNRGGRYDFGNSVLRFDASMRMLDSFAPSNWQFLNNTDGDLGSSSPVLVANGTRVFQIGKAGTGFLLDAAHLGGIGHPLHQGDVCDGLGVWGGMAHAGDTIYVPCGGAIVQLTVKGDSFTTGWRATVPTPGPTVVGNGIVWVIGTDHGTLYAFDAATGQQLVRRSVDSVPSRFTSPALGDGMVILAASRVVHAFGS
jgi:outer membrane protein assembly factor BamB